MNPWLIALVVGGAGLLTYKGVKPIDDFANNFRFYIENVEADFLKIKNATLPIFVKVMLVNHEDYEPEIQSLAVTIYRLDKEKNEWTQLVPSQPMSPFKIPARKNHRITIKMGVPLLDSGSSILDMVSDALTKQKNTYKIQVNTKVKGQILTEEKIMEF